MSWFVSELHAFRSEEAAQHVNFKICLFWIVSCALPLYVDCFLSIVVGVEDNQPWMQYVTFFISFNVALCAYVPVCFDPPSMYLAFPRCHFSSLVC